jgi:hypothetical protein
MALHQQVLVTGGHHKHRGRSGHVGLPAPQGASVSVLRRPNGGLRKRIQTLLRRV